MKSKNDNKKGKYLAGIGAITILSVAAVLTLNFVQQSSQPVAYTVESTISEQKDEAKDHVTYTATAEGSALEQLQATNSSVEIQESDMGKYVSSINGLTGGTDGKYWTLYVDGEMASVGADSYQPTGGEMIEWKFQAL